MKKLFIFTVLAFLLFGIYPQIDLKFSSIFYTEGQGFLYRDSIISNIIYYSVRIATGLVLMMCLFVIFYDQLQKFMPGFLRKIGDRIRGQIKFSTKQIIFLFLVIVITPGILVHWVMKPVWERARPVNVHEFGGDKEYTDFYHLFTGQDGKSFPSGHASMAFSLVAFAYMVSENRRKKLFQITFIYGSIASLCRIWQGGHFLSDVTFSAILTLWTILLLKKLYLDRT